MSRLSLRAKLTSLIGGFLALFVGAMALALHMANAQSQDGAVINLAGQQRMLAVQVTAAFTDLVNAIETESTDAALRETLSARMARFGATLSAFDAGGAVAQHDGAMVDLTPIVGAPRADLALVQDAWAVYQDQVLRVTDGSLEVFSMDYFDALDTAPVLAADVLSGAQALVDALAAQATERNQVLMLVLVASVGVALVLAAAGIWVARGISRPIAAVTSAMTRLADGDTTARVDMTDRRDEIGALAASFRVFRDNAQRADALRAERDKDVAAREQRAQEIERQAATFDAQARTLLDETAGGVQSIHAAARTMSDQMADGQAHAADVGTASSQANHSVGAVAASVEELSVSIAEIAGQVARVKGTVATATDQVTGTMHQVDQLSAITAKVGEVVKLIDAIAAKTNMLALNATIEAARAGEAGRGFAVVANEVKMLSAQTAKATQTINGLIEDVADAAGTMGAGVADMGSMIAQVDGVLAAVAAAVDEQNVATAEIAQNIQRASEGTARLDAQVGDISAIAANCAGSAGSVASISGSVAAQTDDLRNQVRCFLDTLVGSKF